MQYRDNVTNIYIYRETLNETDLILQCALAFRISLQKNISLGTHSMITQLSGNNTILVMQ